jgi:BirA family biotin operon repressor/biotin-[acetyl-CoA-carboxylase] ligase
MVRFEADGFAPFFEAWQEFDWLRGQQVTVETGNGFAAGIAEGVDSDGALLLMTQGDRRRITSGSVTLSAQKGEHP